MGVATLTHGSKVLRFRTDPNSVRWTYNINTSVDETYGGRVVQILSANIDDLTVTADAGGGGWTYLHSVGVFFRDMLFDQRNGGEPGVFSYPPRGWEMSVYALNFPFKDEFGDVRKEFTMSFKVQEDISGIVTTDSIAQEISRLKEGVGWKHNEYNSPPEQPLTAPNPDDGTGPDPKGTTATPAPATPNATPNLQLPFGVLTPRK